MNFEQTKTNCFVCSYPTGGCLGLVQESVPFVYKGGGGYIGGGWGSIYGVFVVRGIM